MRESALANRCFRSRFKFKRHLTGGWLEAVFSVVRGHAAMRNAILESSTKVRSRRAKGTDSVLLKYGGIVEGHRRMQSQDASRIIMAR